MCNQFKPLSNTSLPGAIQSGENLKAEICRCGTVQLHLGPLTLRYTREGFEELSKLVDKVNERLGHRQELPAASNVSVNSFASEIIKKTLPEA